MKNSKKPFFVLILLVSLLWALWWLFSVLYSTPGDISNGQFEENPYITTESDVSFGERKPAVAPPSNLGFEERAIQSVENETFRQYYDFKEELAVVAKTLDRSRTPLEVQDSLAKDPDTLPASNFPDYYLDGSQDVRRLLLIADAFKKKPPLPAGLSLDDPDILEKLFTSLQSSGYIDNEAIPLETEGDIFRLNQQAFELLDDLGMYNSSFAHEGEREQARRAVYETSINAWRGEEIFRGGGNFLNYRESSGGASLEHAVGLIKKISSIFLPHTAQAQLSDIVDNFVTIPDCWKSVGPDEPLARAERGLEGGSNLYAPCCNCGIYYGGGYDIEFVYDCGTYDNLDFPINEDCNIIPLGCINLICFGEEANAIFDGPPGYLVPAIAGYGGGFNVDWSFKCGCDSDIKLGPEASP